MVLCELVWVLSSAYRFERPVILQALRGLLSARALTFRDSAALGRAADAFGHGKGDFADYVILGHAREAGCSSVATFDCALLREGGFVEP